MIAPTITNFVVAIGASVCFGVWQESIAACGFVFCVLSVLVREA